MVSSILSKNERSTLSWVLKVLRTLVSFICFMEESRTPKFASEIYWPLSDDKIRYLKLKDTQAMPLNICFEQFNYLHAFLETFEIWFDFWQLGRKSKYDIFFISYQATNQEFILARDISLYRQNIHLVAGVAWKSFEIHNFWVVVLYMWYANLYSLNVE